MRISDWSSDVCSSDLMGNRLYPIYTSNNPRPLAGSLERPRRRGLRPCLAEQAFDLFCGEPVGLATELAADVGAAPDDRGPGLVPAQRLEPGGPSPRRAGTGEAQALIAQQGDASIGSAPGGGRGGAGVV